MFRCGLWVAKKMKKSHNGLGSQNGFTTFVSKGNSNSLIYSKRGCNLKDTKMNEETFKVRAYGYGELVQLYCPHVTKKVQVHNCVDG